MPTPKMDTTYQTGCFVFGYSIPGFSYFGRHRLYNQQAIFGLRPFGGEIPGKNTENDYFTFASGTPNPRLPYYHDGATRLSIATQPLTPVMSYSHHGTWAKRIIFYERMGRQVMRRYTPADAMAKNTLYPWSLKLMEANFIWSLFDDETKARIDLIAKTTRQASQGKNYFIALYIKDDPRWMAYV